MSERVTYTGDAPRFTSRAAGVSFESGETKDVSDDAADYLGSLDEFTVEDTAGTCDVEKSDGEICGRELPCRFHSDTDDEEDEEDEDDSED